MRQTLRPWQIAALLSSLSLGGMFLAYSKWRVTPRTAEATPAALAAPAPWNEGEEEGLGEEPIEVMSGSKSLLGTGAGAGGAFRGRARPRPPAEAPPAEEPEDDVFLGGSKSMPFEPGLGKTGK